MSTLYLGQILFQVPSAILIWRVLFLFSFSFCAAREQDLDQETRCYSRKYYKSFPVASRIYRVFRKFFVLFRKQRQRLSISKIPRRKLFVDKKKKRT